MDGQKEKAAELCEFSVSLLNSFDSIDPGFEIFSHCCLNPNTAEVNKM